MLNKEVKLWHLLFAAALWIGYQLVLDHTLLHDMANFLSQTHQ